MFTVTCSFSPTIRSQCADTASGQARAIVVGAIREALAFVRNESARGHAGLEPIEWMSLGGFEHAPLLDTGEARAGEIEWIVPPEPLRRTELD